MRLEDMLQNVDVHGRADNLSVQIQEIGLDSRTLKPGSLYVARRGHATDGHTYIPSALSKGASAIVMEERPSTSLLESGVAWVQVEDSDYAMAEMASSLYGRPTESMDVVGITGTNGKTSTAFLVEHALKGCQRKPGLMGTVVQRWPGVSEAANMTTPDAIAIQETARRMADAGADSLILEVSSHAIEQKRVQSIDFTVGAFTNLSQDHLDYHGSMDAYAATKERLFTELLPASASSRGAVINVDDPVGRQYAKVSQGQVLQYGLEANGGLSLTVEGLESTLSGTRGTLQSDWGSRDFSTPLVGRHNTMNFLAAVGCGLLLEAPLDQLLESLSEMASIPGRMNRFTQDGISVFVDYAHTEDALRHVLGAVRELKPNRIITVFGCGGDRDQSKRGPMGLAAIHGSDVVVLTSDNPRHESPESIADDVVSGWGSPRPYNGESGFLIQLNRELAIEEAVSLAREGDVVLVAGKGHEQVQDVGGVKVPFDDQLVVQKALLTKSPEEGVS